MPFLDALGKKEKSVALPDKALDSVGAKSAEEEQRVWNENGKLVAGLYDCGERVDSIAKVGSSAYKVDRGERAGIGVPKHGAPPLGPEGSFRRKRIRQTRCAHRTESIGSYLKAGGPMKIAFNYEFFVL